MKIHIALSLAACATFVGCGASVHELQNVGSDTMLEAAAAWAEAYHQAHPEVVISVSGGGSGIGVKNLIDGDVDIANCSRPFKPEEIKKATEKGHVPVQHQVGYDGIAIYVHKDNPIPSITLEQLKDIFGDGGKTTKWSDLGVKLADPKADPIAIGSRQNTSGTWEYFRDAVLGGAAGRFKSECRNLNSTKDVVDFCAHTQSAIGYSGLAGATKEVRIVPVVGKTGQPVEPTFDTVLEGSYPISRPLFMYTSGEPKDDIKHYLDWILSDAGQRVLASKGYPPLRKLH